MPPEPERLRRPAEDLGRLGLGQKLHLGPGGQPRQRKQRGQAKPGHRERLHKVASKGQASTWYRVAGGQVLGGGPNRLGPDQQHLALVVQQHLANLAVEPDLLAAERHIILRAPGTRILEEKRPRGRHVRLVGQDQARGVAAQHDRPDLVGEQGLDFVKILPCRGQLLPVMPPGRPCHRPRAKVRHTASTAAPSPKAAQRNESDVANGAGWRPPAAASGRDFSRRASAATRRGNSSQ